MSNAGGDGMPAYLPAERTPAESGAPRVSAWALLGWVLLSILLLAALRAAPQVASWTGRDRELASVAEERDRLALRLQELKQSLEEERARQAGQASALPTALSEVARMRQEAALAREERARLARRTEVLEEKVEQLRRQKEDLSLRAEALKQRRDALEQQVADLEQENGRLLQENSILGSGTNRTSQETLAPSLSTEPQAD